MLYVYTAVLNKACILVFVMSYLYDLCYTLHCASNSYTTHVKYLLMDSMSNTNKKQLSVCFLSDLIFPKMCHFNKWCFYIVAALKRKLMLRRSVNELVDQGIYPRKSPFLFIFFCTRIMHVLSDVR